jgi:hypothetical protein
MADQGVHDQNIAPSPSPNTWTDKTEYDHYSKSGWDGSMGDKAVGSEDGGSAETVREMEKRITWKTDIWVVSIVTLCKFVISPSLCA